MEFKPYSGNGKPFVYAMFAPEDREGAEAVLAALREKGYEIWPSARFDQRRIDKSALVLLLLSPAGAANGAVNRAITHTVQSDHPLLAVHLAPTTLSPAQRLLLNTQQGILRYECASEAAFLEKLFGSALMQDLQITPAQKRAAGLATWSLSGGIVFAVALAVVLALQIGATVPEDSLLAGLGYTGRMADINEIYVYGETSEAARKDDVVSGVLYDNMSNVFTDAVFFNGMEEFSPFGAISDVSDFGQLKNLKELSLAGNQISDLSPLWNLGNLEYLNLTGNPIRSLDGIDQLTHLSTLSISGTQITDITPLDACRSLKQVYIDADQEKLFSESEQRGYALITCGPKEEIQSLTAHIFGGPEEDGDDYNVFVKTKSWNIYDDYRYELLKNGQSIRIRNVESISEFDNEIQDKTHVNLNQASFGAYDSSAVYTLSVYYEDWSATYQIAHKYDPVYRWASGGLLISTGGF